MSFLYLSVSGTLIAHRQPYSPVVISVMSSAELWHPCTMLLVQWERSLPISALKRCVSIPCLVPVRVAKDRSIAAWGEPFPGPEWMSLERKVSGRERERRREISIKKNFLEKSTWHIT